jgi:hypothetical protein
VGRKSQEVTNNIGVEVQIVISRALSLSLARAVRASYEFRPPDVI